MRMTNVIKTAIGGLLILGSSQTFAAATDLNVKSINVPVYNVITDTLMSMNAANGKNNSFVMQQICDLARGDKTQQDVTLLLGKNHVDINSIPAEGSVLSLLINGNKPGQAYVCATYLATLLNQPTDNATLFDYTTDKKGNKQSSLNAVKFAGVMRLKMSLAQATAQLYAVIAGNLPYSENSSFSEYQQSVARTVYNYAPEYLRLMKVLYTADTAEYTAGNITKSTLSVADNQGKELQITPLGPVLISRGVMWLGQGKILGMDYFSPVKIIESVQSEQQPDNEVVPQENKKKKKTK